MGGYKMRKIRKSRNFEVARFATKLYGSRNLEFACFINLLNWIICVFFVFYNLPQFLEYKSLRDCSKCHNNPLRETSKMLHNMSSFGVQSWCHRIFFSESRLHSIRFFKEKLSRFFKNEHNLGNGDLEMEKKHAQRIEF